MACSSRANRRPRSRLRVRDSPSLPVYQKDFGSDGGGGGGEGGGRSGDFSSTAAGGRDSITSCRTLSALSATPMLTTQAPKKMARKVRAETGKPEKGVRIVRIPRSISTLARDMGRLYRR